MQRLLFKRISSVIAFLFISSFSSFTTAAVVYIPHMTSGADDWRDFLQVDNNGVVEADYTITLYGGGDIVYSQTRTVPPLSEETVALKPLASEATCGQISFSSTALYFRLSYENTQGGLAEFKLTDTLNRSLGFYFSEFTDAVEIKGIALTNVGDTAADLTMTAVGNGLVLGTANLTVDAYSRILGAHSAWFPDLSSDDVSRITATSLTPTLCGIVINGRADMSNLLFTAADALSDTSISEDPVTEDPVEGNTIAVDDDNLTGISDGSALHPYTTIQSAVDAAPSGSILRIATGTYSETITIAAKSLVLRGGYQGGSSADYTNGTGGHFSQPDWTLNPVRVEGNPARAVVLVRGNTTAGSVLQGLTVTGGKHGIRLDGWPVPTDITIKDTIIENNGQESIPDSGGGIYVTGRRITLQNNRIHHNQAVLGGGIYATEVSDLLVQGNNVSMNTGTGDHGGGLYLAGTGTLSANLIEENDIGSVLEYGWGGGIVMITGNWDLFSNTVRNNHAFSIGGGIFIDDGAVASLQNNLIVKNRVTETGGAGIYVDGAGIGGPDDDRSRAEIINCTVADNTGGSLGGNGLFIEFSDVTVRNTLFWNNGGDDFFTNPKSTLSVAYSLSQEKIPGIGNIRTNPFFYNTGEDDYHLQSASGRWNPVSGQWEVDSNHSPAIDTGDPTSSYTNEPAPNGGTINMGFWGNTSEASKSN